LELRLLTNLIESVSISIKRLIIKDEGLAKFVIRVWYFGESIWWVIGSIWGKLFYWYVLR